MVRRRKAKLKRDRWLSLALIGGVAVIVVLGRPLGDRMAGLESLGYVGAFMMMFLANGTVAIPVPGFVPLIIMGRTFNYWGVVAAGGLGAASGEMVAYVAGMGGGLLVKPKSRRYRRVKLWMKKWGLWVILGLSLVPNPLTDAATIVAGASRVGWLRVWLVLVVGKTLMLAYIVWAGLRSIEWLMAIWG